MWPGKTLPISSYAEWMWCNGAVINDMATNYPELHKVLGRLTLPDLRDKFPMGASNTNSIAQTGGTTSHNHTINDNLTKAGDYGLNTSSNFNNRVVVVADSTESPNISNSASTNLPPYYTVNFIIRVL
jgi:microcystin-dependent protein